MSILKRYPLITGIKSDSELSFENIDYNDQMHINTVVCRQIKFHFGNNFLDDIEISNAKKYDSKINQSHGFTFGEGHHKSHYTKSACQNSNGSSTILSDDDANLKLTPTSYEVKIRRRRACQMKVLIVFLAILAAACIGCIMGYFFVEYQKANQRHLDLTKNMVSERASRLGSNRLEVIIPFKAAPGPNDTIPKPLTNKINEIVHQSFLKMNKTVELIKYYDPYKSADSTFIARVDVELKNAIEFTRVPLVDVQGRISVEKSSKLLKTYQNIFKNVTFNLNLNPNLMHIDYDNIEILFGQKMTDSLVLDNNIIENSRMFTNITEKKSTTTPSTKEIITKTTAKEQEEQDMFNTKSTRILVDQHFVFNSEQSSIQSTPRTTSKIEKKLPSRYFTFFGFTTTLSSTKLSPSTTTETTTISSTTPTSTTTETTPTTSTTTTTTTITTTTTTTTITTTTTESTTTTTPTTTTTTEMPTTTTTTLLVITSKPTTTSTSTTTTTTTTTEPTTATREITTTTTSTTTTTPTTTTTTETSTTTSTELPSTSTTTETTTTETTTRSTTSESPSTTTYSSASTSPITELDKLFSTSSIVKKTTQLIMDSTTSSIGYKQSTKMDTKTERFLPIIEEDDNLMLKEGEVKETKQSSTTESSTEADQVLTKSSTVQIDASLLNNLLLQNQKEINSILNINRKKPINSLKSHAKYTKGLTKEPNVISTSLPISSALGHGPNEELVADLVLDPENIKKLLDLTKDTKNDKDLELLKDLFEVEVKSSKYESSTSTPIAKLGDTTESNQSIETTTSNPISSLLSKQLNDSEPNNLNVLEQIDDRSDSMLSKFIKRITRK